MIALIHRHSFSSLVKRVFFTGTIIFGMLACQQLSPTVVTAIPTTALPAIITVQVPKKVTREVTKQVVVTEEVTRQAPVEVTATQEATQQMVITKQVTYQGPMEATATQEPTLPPPATPTPTAIPPITFSMRSVSGSMGTPFALHTATDLGNGRILLAGGYISYDVDTTRAGIYDPKAHRFRETGSLNVARHDPSATLLQDGRVLVVAGYSNGVWVKSAEIYDPRTGQWSLSEPLFSHGVEHTATLLNDGRVLVMGGADRPGSPGPDDRVEIFNPRTNSWQATAPHMNTEASHTATLLADGRVLIAGGIPDPTIYDPARDAWQPAGQLAVPRWSARAVRLRDGRVLLIGGRLTTEERIVNDVEVYDPASNTWRRAAPMAHARYQFTATLLLDGRVLVTGGQNVLGSALSDPSAILNSVEIYDPLRDTWSELPPLQQSRVDHTATLLPDGSVLVVGGITTNDVILDSVELLFIEVR